MSLYVYCLPRNVGRLPSQCNKPLTVLFNRRIVHIVQCQRLHCIIVMVQVTHSNIGKWCLQGSPSRRTDLRAVHVERCSMCVILSAKKKIMVDQTLLDKETILTNLNVKGMSCGDVEERIKSIGGLIAFLNYSCTWCLSIKPKPNIAATL